MRPAPCILTVALSLSLPASPLIGQDTDRPSDRAAQPERVEQLEQLRIRELRNALQLNERQTRELETVMREFRHQNREINAERRNANQRLRRALAGDPVDEDEVSRALEAVEAQRRATEQLRDRQRQRLGQFLTPQQRAKFLLFNRRFDARLRQLIAERRGVHRQDQPRNPRGVRQPRGSNALQNQPDRRPDQPRPRD